MRNDGHEVLTGKVRRLCPLAGLPLARQELRALGVGAGPVRDIDDDHMEDRRDRLAVDLTPGDLEDTFAVLLAKLGHDPVRFGKAAPQVGVECGTAFRRQKQAQGSPDDVVAICF